MSINYIKEKAIIISASGMMTGGRILHHLYNRLPRKQDTLLLVGYQAEGTRGRRIAEGEEKIKIFGQFVPVICKVEIIDGLSAHAWLTTLRRRHPNTKKYVDFPNEVQFATNQYIYVLSNKRYAYLEEDEMMQILDNLTLNPTFKVASKGFFDNLMSD